VLELRSLTFQTGSEPDAPRLLDEVSLKLPKRHFVAVLGPSGCGKSTLLKVVAGLAEATEGQILWEGRDLASQGDFEPQEVGYVPQFGIAYDLLTVEESLRSAMQLRVGEAPPERLAKILADVGLGEIADRQVQRLSGGQKRRLALAMELSSSPKLLLCDEVTSGLDPKSEDEIVQLMHAISQGGDRLVLSVTHSLRHMELYDRVLVLFQGRVVFYGPTDLMLHYFGLQHPEELFPLLALRQAADWHRSWDKHRSGYNQELEPKGEQGVAGEETKGRSADGPETGHGGEGKRPELPSFGRQVAVLLARRMRLFSRDRGQLLLQAALLFGFPLLVVIFAMDGLPALRALTDPVGGNVFDQVRNEMAHRMESLRTGSLVSGLIMFQVVLLALMGSNNAAREIAGERLILEKEKFAGLRPGAYVLSKVLFLGLMVTAQSVWMGLFVDLIVDFPGGQLAQILLLTLVNASLTAVCLGLSAVMKSAEQASLLSVYLVGFQLPLSGAVLALPAALATVTRPFIASYWGWAGFIQTFRDTRFFDAVQMVSRSPTGAADPAGPLASSSMAVWVLCAHVVLGIIVAYTGAKSSRWE